MSSYIDHVHFHPAGFGTAEGELVPVHSWWDFTLARLEWLYGEGRTNTSESFADIAAWNRLGQRRDAA